MSKLTVIRHAQASLMKDDYDQLSDLGNMQAARLADYLVVNGIHFDKIYLGTLKRHQQTADYIRLAFEAKNIPYQQEKLAQLNEHQSAKVAKWMLERVLSEEQSPQLDQLRKVIENVDDSHPKQKYLAIFDLVSAAWAKGEIDTSNLEVEGFPHFKARVHTALNHILSTTESGQHIAIVTSGGPTAIATGKALELSNGKIMELNAIIRNSAVTEFLFSKNRFSLHGFNGTAHLKEEGFLTYV